MYSVCIDLPITQFCFTNAHTILQGWHAQTYKVTLTISNNEKFGLENNNHKEYVGPQRKKNLLNIVLWFSYDWIGLESLGGNMGIGAAVVSTIVSTPLGKTADSSQYTDVCDSPMARISDPSGPSQRANLTVMSYF